MALNDLRNRKKKKVGSNWVGENTTWVGRNDNVIAPKAGSQKKKLNQKSRYSSGVKSRTDLLAGVKNLVKNLGDRSKYNDNNYGLSMAKGSTNRKPKKVLKQKRKRYSGGALK